MNLKVLCATLLTTRCNRGNLLFTEFDCSVFGSLVLLYGAVFRY